MCWKKSNHLHQKKIIASSYGTDLLYYFKTNFILISVRSVFSNITNSKTLLENLLKYPFPDLLSGNSNLWGLEQDTVVACLKKFPRWYLDSSLPLGKGCVKSEWYEKYMLGQLHGLMIKTVRSYMANHTVQIWALAAWKQAWCVCMHALNFDKSGEGSAERSHPTGGFSLPFSLCFPPWWVHVLSGKLKRESICRPPLWCNGIALLKRNRIPHDNCNLNPWPGQSARHTCMSAHDLMGWKTGGRVLWHDQTLRRVLITLSHYVHVHTLS